MSAQFPVSDRGKLFLQTNISEPFVWLLEHSAWEEHSRRHHSVSQLFQDRRQTVPKITYISATKVFLVKDES